MSKQGKRETKQYELSQLLCPTSRLYSLGVARIAKLYKVTVVVDCDDSRALLFPDEESEHTLEKELVRRKAFQAQENCVRTHDTKQLNERSFFPYQIK